jgi:hypothetical protein
MNTTITTTRTATRSAALAACLTLLFAGATACGSDSKHAGGDRAPAAQTETHPNALTSVDLIELAKSNQTHLVTPPVDWSPWPHESQGRHHVSTGQHAPGYNKALLAER